MADPSLFDEEPPPLPSVPADLFAEVVFNRPLRTTFSYEVGPEQAGQIYPGKRIRAPFGRSNKLETGYCVSVTQVRPEGPLKRIDAVLDEVPLLSASMLRLARWIADYYFCGWGQVLDAALPRAVKDSSGGRWIVFLEPTGNATADPDLLTPKQRQAWEALVALERPATLEEAMRLGRVGPAVLRAMVKNGLLKATRKKIANDPEEVPVPRVKPLVLSAHQQAALDPVVQAIHGGTHAAFLLHGVTGSGKTEVYLQAIAQVVKRGREAIVLVPEISLTPQTIERFRGRFDSVAVLHSHLTDAERHRQWRRIARGEVQVVVGARSAIFAPCRHLGLIVLDEEHENTFKQETSPRYHARDVAWERARLEEVPLLLGSATPSLESWLAAHHGSMRLLRLPERVGNLRFPAVHGIDMRQEYRSLRGLASIGPRLVQAIHDCLSHKGQTILLLNRRGFAPAIVCPQCGHVETCAHCDISLTFHKNRGQAICHSCDATMPAPRACSKCGHRDLKLTGFGTQRLEDEVRARFPNARLARMDSDTMKSAGHYEKVLADFRAGEVDILLGTQMIAKGLDFPNVRLVGVISADTARHLPDFRAAEKTFQLIVQVSGRAGRGADPGQVLVQTFDPDDFSIRTALRGDYEQFVREELPARRNFHYPPYGKLVRIIVRSTDDSVARAAAQTIADRIKEHAQAPTRVLGPAPAPVTRLRDYFRHHLLIHTPDAPTRSALLEATFANLSLPANVEHAVDVDPVDLL